MYKIKHNNRNVTEIHWVKDGEPCITLLLLDEQNLTSVTSAALPDLHNHSIIH